MSTDDKINAILWVLISAPDRDVALVYAFVMGLRAS